MFRCFCFLSCMLLTLVFTAVVSAQSEADIRKVEREVRLADQAAARAILERDEAAIDLYFASSSVTNNPRGGLTHGSNGVKELFKTGVINYAAFERTIEHVQIHGNTAIVMGNETLTTAPADGKAGELVKRRYTNVWIKNGTKWQIIARHASVVCN